MAYLLVTLDKTQETHRVELRSPFRVGRHVDSDLAILDVRTSRHHLRFEQTSRGWEAFDDGSTSGAYINHERMGESRLLQHGDVISIGGANLTFRLE